MKKILFIIILAGISMVPCKAQQQIPVKELKSASSDILEWITDLNNRINTFFKQEKAARLNRNLGYLRNDLYQYLVARRAMMIYLEQHNFEVPKGYVQPQLSNLETRLKIMLYRLGVLSGYTNSDFIDSANEIIEPAISIEQQQQQLVLTPLQNLLDGLPVDKTELRKNAELMYIQLTKSRELITKLQLKIQSMMK